jgi:hypothetical protein
MLRYDKFTTAMRVYLSTTASAPLIGNIIDVEEILELAAILFGDPVPSCPSGQRQWLRCQLA